MQVVAQQSSVVPFSSGDMAGKRELAVKDATEQAAIQPPGSAREKLYKLQAAIGDLPEIDCPLQHVFAPGVYARTIFIPKNGVVVGKIHKHKHLNILSQGAVLVMTEAGGVEHLVGPLTMVSEPGTKRAVQALTDVVWTTIHLTNETDLDKIEDEVIAKSYPEYEQFFLEHQPKRHDVVRGDFLRVLAETGCSAEWVRSVTENTADLMGFPAGFDHLRLAPSMIEGTGLFTDIAIESGAVVGPARIDGKRTPLGRYANHSPWPNVEFRALANGDLESIALRAIEPGEEILNDYRQGAQLAGFRLDPAEVARTQARRQLFIDQTRGNI